MWVLRLTVLCVWNSGTGIGFYPEIRIYEIAMLENQVFALDMPVEKLSYLDALVENIRKMKIYIFFLKEFRKQT